MPDRESRRMRKPRHAAAGGRSCRSDATTTGGQASGPPAEFETGTLRQEKSKRAKIALKDGSEVDARHALVLLEDLRAAPAPAVMSFIPPPRAGPTGRCRPHLLETSSGPQLPRRVRRRPSDRPLHPWSLYGHGRRPSHHRPLPPAQRGGKAGRRTRRCRAKRPDVAQLAAGPRRRRPVTVAIPCATSSVKRNVVQCVAHPFPDRFPASADLASDFLVVPSLHQPPIDQVHSVVGGQ